jgi:hypothetical protein
MKKSTWIIIGASVLGAAVLGFILMRRKKTAISEESPIEEEAKPSVTTAPKTAVSPIPAQKVVTAQPSVKTSAPTTTTTGVSGSYSKAVLDESKKKTILHVKPKNLFKVGDSVKVAGNTYKGTYKVWYIYKSNPSLDAVYIETPFVSDDAGTITKA